MASSDDSTPRYEVNDSIKMTAAKWLRHQPFLHILLLAILGSAVWLVYSDKRESIPLLMEVGSYAVGVTLVGVLCSWFSPRIQVVVDSVKIMTETYQRLVLTQEYLLRSQEQIQLSLAIIQRFMASSQQERSRANTLVLLVEDSNVETCAVRMICADLIAEFHLSFRDVGTLGEAYAYLPSCCVAMIDVNLPDNEDPAAINTLIDLAGCPVIVHSGSPYSKSDFPNAFEVLVKDGSVGFDKLRETMRRAIASTRFPRTSR